MIKLVNSNFQTDSDSTAAFKEVKPKSVNMIFPKSQHSAEVPSIVEPHLHLASSAVFSTLLSSYLWYWALLPTRHQNVSSMSKISFEGQQNPCIFKT